MATTDPALTPQPRKPGTRRNRRRRDCLRATGFFLALSLATSTGIAVLVHHWLTPVTVSFDLTRTLNQFRDQVAQQISADNPLTEAQIADTSRRFQSAMSHSLDEYSRRHNAVILVTPAVVSGTADITADIQTAIAQRMAEGGE